MWKRQGDVAILDRFVGRGLDLDVWDNTGWTTGHTLLLTDLKYMICELEVIIGFIFWLLFEQGKVCAEYLVDQIAERDYGR